MSGGKRKKSSSSAATPAKLKKTSEPASEVVETEKPIETSAAVNNAVDVLDRLAPPILFFPPNVSEEYLNRFCPEPSTSNSASSAALLADEGFPDREIPVMRRLLAMMAGIMSKASSASARAYYSRVAGTEGRRNGYFQQNLNTSVFNLFSTLSASGNGTGESSGFRDPRDTRDLHLTPPVAFTAKDGESLRGYPQRLMKFWRQLSPAEQLRLVKEEHAALTNSWIESRKSWCLCAHCKHRRMTISDLTDCLYQTYCEELEAFITSGGQGSSLYAANLTNSMEPAARARRFLFKSLSVVGEQALLPRYNQFILRLEAFSSMAFSLKDQGIQGTPKAKPGSAKCTGTKPTGTSNSVLPNLKPSSLKSAALQASKEFLQKHGRNPTATDLDEEMTISLHDPNFDPKNPMKGLTFKIIQDSDEELEDFVREHRIRRNYADDTANLISDSEEEEEVDSEFDDEERESHQGGIQSEDDDDLIDEETDLPVDESELMLPGGSSFPLLPAGEGPVQWSESSRIECGRTVFLMFASEMFQYRLTAAHLAHQTRLRQLKLIAEVEEEERVEKELRLKDEKEKKERAENEKKKKAAKKEKAAAKANGTAKKSSGKNAKSAAVPKPVPVPTKVVAEVVETETASDSEPEPVRETDTDTVVPVVSAAVSSVGPVVHVPVVTVSSPVHTQENAPTQAPTPLNAPTPLTAPAPLNAHPSIFDFSIPIIPTAPAPVTTVDDSDDFDPTELVEQLAKEMNRFELNSSLNSPHNSPPGFAPPPGFPATPKHLDDHDTATPLFHYQRPPFAFEPRENYEDRSGGGMYYEAPMYGNGNSGHVNHPHDEYHSQYNNHNSHNGHNGHYNSQTHGHQGGHQNHQASAHYPPHHPQYNPHPPQYNAHNGPQYNAHNPQYNHAPHAPFGYQQQHNAPPAPSAPAGFSPFDDDSTKPDSQQSRFQSFFSKSIFGPSSFFSQ